MPKVSSSTSASRGWIGSQAPPCSRRMYSRIYSLAAGRMMLLWMTRCSKSPTPGFLLQQPHGRAFDVEAAHGAALGHGLLGGGGRPPAPSRARRRRRRLRRDSAERIADHPQAAVAQQVDLDQPGVLGGVLLPLDDRHPLGGALDRDVVVDRTGGDDDPARVDREVARGADEPAGHAQDLGPGRRELQLLELGARAQRAQKIGSGLLQAPVPGQALGDPADFRRGQTVDLGDLAHGHARLEEDVVGHHGGVAAVAGEHGRKHRVALVPGKVDVDVGRVRAAGVEKAFEVEVVLERADVGDAQAVGDQ